MCWNEKGNSKVLKKFYMQKMGRAYLRGGGGCEAAVTARTRCGWVKLRKCCDFLYGKEFSSKAKRGCL